MMRQLASVVGGWARPSLLGLGVLASVSPVAAQTTVEPGSEMSHALQKVQSSRWRTRADGFDALVELAIPKDFDPNAYMVQPGLDVLLRGVPQRREPITVALIGLLERENRSKASISDEGYWNYLGELVGAVASLHDKRAVAALMGHIQSGKRATNGLAALGIDALDSVLRASSSVDLHERHGAVMTLDEMLNRQRLLGMDEVAIGKIKTALIRTAREENYYIRLTSVEALGKIDGDDVTMLLQEIAKTDAMTRPAPDGSGQVRYPAREAAVGALRKRNKK